MNTDLLHSYIQKAFADLDLITMAKTWVQYTGTSDEVINDLIYNISGLIDHEVTNSYGLTD
jgi:hypothetical protein